MTQQVSDPGTGLVASRVRQARIRPAVTVKGTPSAPREVHQPHTPGSTLPIEPDTKLIDIVGRLWLLIKNLNIDMRSQQEFTSRNGDTSDKN